MAFETDFLEFMIETVTLAPYLYMNGKKEKQYGTAVSYRARVAGKGVSLRRNDKEEFANIVDVWFYAQAITVTIDDLLTLPAGPWVDLTPAIFAIGRYTDDDGQHHTKLQCGWMYHRQGQ